MTLVDTDETPLGVAESHYPTGWFQIGWSAEIAAGEVRSLRYFGQDLVLWRGESGELHVMDAYCLHLGANIGVGGKVFGEDVACPFHGWRWSGTGANTLIPFSSLKCKPGLQMKAWPVRDWFGCIVVWHDTLGRGPLWEPEVIDELEDGSRYPMEEDMRAVFRIKAHPQMVLENGPDAFHVAFVHGGQLRDIAHFDPPETLRFEPDGHMLVNTLAVPYGSGKKETWLTPGGPQRITVTASISGIGLAVLRWSDGFYGAINFTNISPVDETFTDYFWGMTVRRDDTDEPRPGGRARKVIDHQKVVIQQDFPIWEHMRVAQKPNFAPEEAKNFATLRRWARQFYPEMMP